MNPVIAIIIVAVIGVVLSGMFGKGFALLSIVAVIAYIIYENIKRKKNIDKTLSNISNLQSSFDYINYLGGHPLVEISNVKEGTLYISLDSIKFWDTKNNKEVFKIPVNNIKNCTVETKESLTVSRILLTGIFAWALKKNQSYIRIEFFNELNDSNNIIFYPQIDSNTLAPKIVKDINEQRIKIIKEQVQ